MPGVNSPSIDWLLASRLFEAGRIAEARAAAERLLAEDSVKPYAQQLLGRIAAASGDRDAAMARIREAIALDDSVASFHHDLGNLLQDQQLADQAISAYRKALRLHPDYAAVLNDLATAYVSKGWLDEAETLLQRAIELEPSHAVAFANLGLVSMRRRRYAAAWNSYAREFWLRTSSRLRSIGGRGRRTLVTADGELDLRRIVEEARRVASREGRGIAQALCLGVLALRPDEPGALTLLLEGSVSARSTEAAIGCARRAAELRPRDARYQLLLGDALFRGEDLEGAAVAYRAAGELKPGHPEVPARIGAVLMKQGATLQALELFRKAVHNDAGRADAWARLGHALVLTGRQPEASEPLGRALQLDPANVIALKAMVQVALFRGQPARAQEYCQRLIALHPADPDNWNLSGLAYREQGAMDAAIGSLREATLLDANYWQAFSNLGMYLSDLGRRDEAIVCLRRALQIRPDSVDPLLHLARLYRFDANYGECRRHLEQAKAAWPGVARVWEASGHHASAVGEKARAIADFRRAVELEPRNTQAQFGLAQALLASERLAEGWVEYDARLELPIYRRHHVTLDLPRWAGEDLTGKAIVAYWEQGLGDQIMFSSCLPDLLGKARARRCVVLCDPKLLQIFGRSFPDVEVYACDEPDFAETARERGAGCDVQAATGSLPRYFRNSLQEFPQHCGFLRADPGKTSRWRERLDELGSGIKVGISWKGGLYVTEEIRRTLTLERLLPLLRVDGANFVSLQYTECSRDLAALKDRHGITVHHWQEAIDDYDETAALVCALDLVISVCTAVVHLSGALGKPVWVMAPYSPGWRYAMIPGGMPWYPSVKVIRQPALGEWDPVIGQIRTDLEDFVASRKGR